MAQNLALLNLARFLLLPNQTQKQREATMQNNFETQPKATGTTIGAALSLLMIVTFGFTSLLSHQKDTGQYANTTNNPAAAVRAYLA
jgi:hypothetical protein